MNNELGLFSFLSLLFFSFLFDFGFYFYFFIILDLNNITSYIIVIYITKYNKDMISITEWS